MSESPLTIDVYVSPRRPYTMTPQGPGDVPTWAPMSSTLIAGADERSVRCPLRLGTRLRQAADRGLYHARPHRSLGRAGAGDVCYNNVHMMMFEAGEPQRDAWIASLDAIAALAPKTVVAGHKPVGAPDGPENIAASQQYLRDFSRVANESDSAQAIVDAMLALHGDREQPHTVWLSANAEIGRRN